MHSVMNKNSYIYVLHQSFGKAIMSYLWLQYFSFKLTEPGVEKDFFDAQTNFVSKDHKL